MGSICISNNKDTNQDEEYSPKIQNTKDEGIQTINQTKIVKNNHLKHHKESPQDGIQVQNIQTIVLMPKNADEGAKIIRDLIQYGNQVILVSKNVSDSPQTSLKSLSRKGILKNKSQVHQSQEGTINFYISPQNKSTAHNSTDSSSKYFLSQKNQHNVNIKEQKRCK